MRVQCQDSRGAEPGDERASSFIEAPAGALARTAQLMVGLVAAGIGTTLMIDARLGLSPWYVLHQGLSDRTSWQIGTVGIALGCLILLTWIPLRQRIGIGTVLNVVIIGMCINVLLEIPFTTDALAPRVAALVIGDLLIAIGLGVYIGAGLGTGPRDGLMTGLVARGLPLRAVRTAIELSVLVLGWLLGGTVGVGTVLFAVTVGPLLHMILHRVNKGPLDSTTAANHLDAAASDA